MTTEELTYLSIRAAVACYCVTMALRLTARIGLARWFWTIGCLCYLVHVGCAFDAFYSWSHQVAFKETARQTAERFGTAVGSGIYWNYLFTALWVGDVGFWWWKGAPPLRVGMDGFFAFMFLNGVVIFPQGNIRYFGAVAALLLLGLLLRRR